MIQFAATLYVLAARTRENLTTAYQKRTQTQQDSGLTTLETVIIAALLAALAAATIAFIATRVSGWSAKIPE